MNAEIKSLSHFLSGQRSLVVLSGAGISTASGIPDYRDREGNWKPGNPIQYGDFMRNAESRQRYWARSFIGWQRFSVAHPNEAHHALVSLESSGRVDTLITQNVDGLHRKAGSHNIIDLHGILGRVRCVSCNTLRSRQSYQAELKEANPTWQAVNLKDKPDGDAELGNSVHENFVVPQCAACDGVIKPDVVMFGESVPKDRVTKSIEAVDRADALLVVGTSLTVFSGFRFARYAHEQDKPIAIVNQGRTRADDLATLKIEQDCTQILPAAVELSAA